MEEERELGWELGMLSQGERRPGEGTQGCVDKGGDWLSGVPRRSQDLSPATFAEDHLWSHVV